MKKDVLEMLLYKSITFIFNSPILYKFFNNLFLRIKNRVTDWFYFTAFLPFLIVKTEPTPIILQEFFLLI